MKPEGHVVWGNRVSKDHGSVLTRESIDLTSATSLGCLNPSTLCSHFLPSVSSYALLLAATGPSWILTRLAETINTVLFKNRLHFRHLRIEIQLISLERWFISLERPAFTAAWNFDVTTRRVYKNPPER